MPSRRQFLVAGLGATAAPSLATSLAINLPLNLKSAVLTAEATTGGRIGLTVHDTASGRLFTHRGNELFPMASTFKALLAAAILHRVDEGKESLSRAIPIKKSDIVSNSPVSEKHIGSTATVGVLTEATVIYSDNTAANLLLPSLGGPAGFTAWLRRIGDPVTRLDRYEVMMSEATPGDPRDTTSPNAVLDTWQRLLLGNTLSAASRTQLINWLIANTTGGTRLRAGLPKSWIVGDKTGTGGHGTVNDIAIIWPRPSARPLFIASFITGGTAASEVLYKTHADLARAVAEAIQA